MLGAAVAGAGKEGDCLRPMAGTPAEPNEAATGKDENAAPGEPLLVAALLLARVLNGHGSMMSGETAESRSE